MVKKTIHYAVYFFIIYLTFSGCTCYENGKLNLLKGQDSLRNVVSRSVHTVNYNDVSSVTIKNVYKKVKAAQVDSANDIKLFCESLNKKIDTARTDRNYDAINVYEILMLKKDSSEIKFELVTSNKNGVFTDLFSDGWEGWAYGGYRVDDQIMNVLKKYSLEK